MGGAESEGEAGGQRDGRGMCGPIGGETEESLLWKCFLNLSK